MPVGVDQDVFRPLAHVARVPGRLLVTTSSDQPLKGLVPLLEAVAKVRTERDDVHLVVIGKPKDGSKIPALLEKLGLRPHVEFVSGVSTERIVELYAECEVAVVPSLYEGFSLPAIEAMSCAAPLVTTTGGALPEVTGPVGRGRAHGAAERPRRAGDRDRHDARRPRAAGPARRGRPGPGPRPLHLAQDRRGHDRELVRDARDAPGCAQHRAAARWTDRAKGI